MVDNILEMGLPEFLQHDIDAYIKGQQDDSCTVLDCLHNELYGSINSAFWGKQITEEQATYLRDKYLWG